MYYIVLGIITIICFSIDIYYLLVIGKLMWERMTTKERAVKIITWILAFLTAGTLIVKGIIPAQNDLEVLESIATIEYVK